MINIKAALEDLYGTNYRINLSHFGVDADAITDKYQALYDNGEYNEDIFAQIMAETPEQSAVRDCRNEIRDTLLDCWCNAITREQMAAISVAASNLSLGCEIEYLPGEKISDQGLMTRWNRLHPDDKIAPERRLEI